MSAETQITSVSDHQPQSVLRIMAVKSCKSLQSSVISTEYLIYLNCINTDNSLWFLIGHDVVGSLTIWKTASVHKSIMLQDIVRTHRWIQVTFEKNCVSVSLLPLTLLLYLWLSGPQSTGSHCDLSSYSKMFSSFVQMRRTVCEYLQWGIIILLETTCFFMLIKRCLGFCNFFLQSCIPFCVNFIHGAVKSSRKVSGVNLGRFIWGHFFM